VQKCSSRCNSVACPSAAHRYCEVNVDFCPFRPAQFTCRKSRKQHLRGCELTDEPARCGTARRDGGYVLMPRPSLEPLGGDAPLVTGTCRQGAPVCLVRGVSARAAACHHRVATGTSVWAMGGTGAGAARSLDPRALLGDYAWQTRCKSVSGAATSAVQQQEMAGARMR
jgi:hypothetical protein